MNEVIKMTQSEADIIYSRLTNASLPVIKDAKRNQI
jgi:hypothetical protein